MTEEANEKLIVGGRNSMRSTLLIAAVTSLVMPGFGVVILPLISLKEFQWGGLAWVSFWVAPAFIVRGLQREHRLDGEAMVSSYRRGVVRRSLREVVVVRPAPLMLPAARLRFSDGATVWVYGPVVKSYISAVLQRATFADNQLPAGDWLRPRRRIWFVLWVLGEVENAA